MKHFIKEKYKTLKDFIPEKNRHREASQLAIYLLDCSVILVNHPLNLEHYLKDFRSIFINDDLMQQICFYCRLALANYHIEKSKGSLERKDAKNVSTQISSYNYLISKLTYECFDELEDPERSLTYMIGVELEDKDQYKKQKAEALTEIEEGLFSLLDENISKALQARISRFLVDAHIYEKHIPMRKEMDWCNSQFSGKCQGREICVQLQNALEQFYRLYNEGKKNLEDLNRVQNEIQMANHLLTCIVRDIYSRGDYCHYDYDDLQLGHGVSNNSFVLEKGLTHFIDGSTGEENIEKINDLFRLAYQFDSYLEKEDDWESFKESLMGDFSFLALSKILNQAYSRYFDSFKKGDAIRNSTELVNHQVHLINRMLKSAYAELADQGYEASIPYKKVRIKERH